MIRLNKKFRSFLKGAKSIALKDQEKDAVWRLLEAHIDEGVRAMPEPRLGKQRSRIKFALPIMPLILAITIALGGGTALAANGSLPGDFLYPVKVGFNEQLRSTLALTAEAKAEFQSELAGRRLEEFQKLTSEAEVDVEATERIAANFDAHADRSLDLIERLEAEGKFDAAARVSSGLRNSLEAHERILNRLADNRAEFRERLDGIRARIQAKIDATAEAEEDAQAELEQQVDASVEVNARLRAYVDKAQEKAEQAVKTAKRNLEKHADELSARAEARISAQIAEAEEAIVEGDAQINEGNITAALRFFNRATGLASEADLNARIFAYIGLEDSTDEDDSDETDADRDDQDEDDQTEDDDESESGADADADVDVRIDTGIIKIDGRGKATIDLN